MDAPTLLQDEATPESYPTSPSTLSTTAAALDPAMVWQRLEAHVAYRWTEREVKWIVDGPGAWRPPLAPATITATEVWTGESWLSVTLTPTPAGGFELPSSDAYRFSATVGGGDVPAAVTEAFRRLAEYMAAKAGKPGATSERIQAGSIALSHSRDANWMAQALQSSGAADLLRHYRRA